LQSEYDARTVWAQSLDAERVSLSSQLEALREKYEGEAHLVQSLTLDLGAARGEIDELNASRVAIAADRNRLEGMLSKEQEQYNRILRSRSWRLTRPLRFAARVLRGDWQGVVAR